MRGFRGSVVPSISTLFLAIVLSKPFFNPLVQLIADLMRLKDYAASQIKPEYVLHKTESFDFIIVGGGSAGGVVANRLSRNPKHRVLLLEAGGDPNPLSEVPYFVSLLARLPSINYNYKSVPQKNFFISSQGIVSLSNGIGLGGSSNVNAMVYTRGNPRDYDQWASLTEDPVWKYENVIKYFKRIEDYHGYYQPINGSVHSTGGEIGISKSPGSKYSDYLFEAARERGLGIIDYNGDQGEGFSKVDRNIRRGRRSGGFQGFLRPIMGRPNLHIYRYARAIKVHLDKAQNAYGVTYVRHGQLHFVRARKEIILSAGTIGTPRLLLLSGIGPREHLTGIQIKCKVDLPVGKNLQEHVRASFSIGMGPNVKLIPVQHELTLNDVYDYVKHGRGLLRTCNHCDAFAVGFVSSRMMNDPRWPDTQYLTSPSRNNGQDLNTATVGLARPYSRSGTVTLPSKDWTALPLIDFNFFSHDGDIDRLIDGIEKIVSIYETSASFKRLNATFVPPNLPKCERFRIRSRGYWDCYVHHLTNILWHPVGTAKMGKDGTDPTAVVDSRLRVINTKNLRVIDCSIMPIIINANTNIPAMVIGDLGSDFILDDWSQSDTLL